MSMNAVPFSAVSRGGHANGRRAPASGVSKSMSGPGHTHTHTHGRALCTRTHAVGALFLGLMCISAFVTLRATTLLSSSRSPGDGDEESLVLTSMRVLRGRPESWSGGTRDSNATLDSRFGSPGLHGGGRAGAGVTGDDGGDWRGDLVEIWKETHGEAPGPPGPGAVVPDSVPTRGEDETPTVAKTEVKSPRLALETANVARVEAAAASPGEDGGSGFPASLLPKLMSTDVAVYTNAGLQFRAKALTRSWRSNPRAGKVPKANADDDPDLLLLHPDEDAFFGVASVPAAAPPSQLDAQLAHDRRMHELHAETAIVVLSAPRMAAGTTRGAGAVLGTYFRSAGQCNGPPYRRVPAEAGLADDMKWMENVAKMCNADDRCAGFDGSGSLFDRLDVFSCALSMGAPMADDAVRMGVYTKAPVTVMPRPWCIATAAGEKVAWWTVARADVYQHDIRMVDRTNGGRFASEQDQLAHVMRECEAEPKCEGFAWPSGWLKSSTDITHITTRGHEGQLYSRKPLPPLDYLTATVVSLVREMGGGNSCGETNKGYVEPGAAPMYPPQAAFNGSTHLYVVDTSSLALQGAVGNAGGSTRGPFDPDYWFSSFAYLRREYGHLPCVTFLPATAYERLRETAPPAHGRGMPAWHPDNRGRVMLRGQVGQTLDFVSGIRHAAGASPRAHLMVWEDDCVACAGTLAYLSDSVAAVKAFDAGWGALKVGNGGSGLLFNADLGTNLLKYLVTRRGSENVDVSMWRYLHSGAYSDYLSRKTFAAHRGYHSSFRVGGAGWGRVACGNDLDYYWGFYQDCKPTIPTLQSPAAVDFGILWRCSVYSPATEGKMPSTK